jgi:hypothetical protein
MIQAQTRHTSESVLEYIHAGLARPNQPYRLVEVAKWMTHVSIKERELICRRAAKTPWKAICWEFNISHATGDRMLKRALTKIADGLNGNKCNKCNIYRGNT